MVVQIWRCLTCEARRIWGGGVWEPTHYTPYLLCDVCKRHTAHIFHTHRGEDSGDLPVPPQFST